jgi:two-component system KDP operon response regulator KdpE
MILPSSRVSLPRPSDDAPPAGHLRILVIDDDDYVHVSLHAALRSLRAEIIRAGSAAEGLELARRHRPDLAIVDLGLPDADGYHLTRWLRAEPGLEGMRIMIVTGHLPDEVAASAAGADEILGKPFSLHESLEAVRRQLRTRSLAS